MGEIAYETPEKQAFRDRAVAAFEQAGFVLEQEIQAVPLPQEFGRDASVLGDFQGRPNGEPRKAFYLVMDGSKALSPWLANVARGGQAVQGVEVFAVVQETSEALETSCRTSGAGLFRLDSDGSVHLLLDPAAHDPTARRRQLRRRMTDLRNRARSKRRLNQGSIQDDYSAVSDLTAELTREDQQEWRRDLEEEDARWTGWSDHVDGLIEDAENLIRAARWDECDELLDAIEALILQEPDEG